MKLLFIAEAYAPDSIIGAQRIIKFTKYLSQMGHDITVLTTSRICQKADQSSMEGLENVRIVRTDGNDLEELNLSNSAGLAQCLKKKLPSLMFKCLKRLYQEIFVPIYSLKETNFVYQKMLECYERNLSGNEFDIVFSTYSTMPDVLMGEYIHKHYGIPFVFDLRDKMDNALVPYFLRIYYHKIQGRIIGEAAKTFIVSEVAMNELKHDYPDNAKKIVTLYNGFDNKVECQTEINDEIDVLSFAYTGGLYSGQRDLRPLFKVMKDLMDNGRNRFRLEYAGEDFEILLQQADQYQMGHIIHNHGKVSREEAENIQNNADVFLVASWNSIKVQGALTGKFFEGIRANKPIVVIVTGDLENSELYQLNKKFNYGICCETVREGAMQELYNYLDDLCRLKRNGTLKHYSAGEALREKFHYKNLSKELEGYLLQVLEDRS